MTQSPLQRGQRLEPRSVMRLAHRSASAVLAPIIGGMAGARIGDKLDTYRQVRQRREQGGNS